MGLRRNYFYIHQVGTLQALHKTQNKWMDICIFLLWMNHAKYVVIGKICDIYDVN